MEEDLNKMRKEPDENCDHILERIGCWDGIIWEIRTRVAGPMAQCTKCNGISYMSMEEWRALPEEKKIINKG